jgi:hypothetical protein
MTDGTQQFGKGEHLAFQVHLCHSGGNFLAGSQIFSAGITAVGFLTYLI